MSASSRDFTRLFYKLKWLPVQIFRLKALSPLTSAPPETGLPFASPVVGESKRFEGLCHMSCTLRVMWVSMFPLALKWSSFWKRGPGMLSYSSTKMRWACKTTTCGPWLIFGSELLLLSLLQTRQQEKLYLMLEHHLGFPYYWSMHYFHACTSII